MAVGVTIKKEHNCLDFFCLSHYNTSKVLKKPILGEHLNIWRNSMDSDPGNKRNYFFICKGGFVNDYILATRRGQVSSP